MSDYFDRFEGAMDAVLERRAHLRWYRRIRASRGGRASVAVAVSCALLAPAVAVSGWVVLDGQGPAAPPVAAIAHAPEGLAATELLSLRIGATPSTPAWDITSRFCGAETHAARHQSSVPVSLPRWPPSTGS